MIDLTQKTTLQRFRGSRAASIEMTVQQAKLEAQFLIARGLSLECWHALDLLATGGVLSLDQLSLSERTLRGYAALRILDRLPYLARELAEALNEYGLPVNGKGGLLYTLGPVGLEIAKQRHGQPPPTGYLGYPLQRTMHDVVLNEIVLRLARYAETLGWAVSWLSHYEATLSKDSSPILEPDALLILCKDGQERAFLIEYHNEDKQTRAHDKVRRYEAAFTSGLWQSQWDTDTFPIVLAVFKLPIVAEGYQNAIREREQIHCTYYGKLLSGLLNGNLGEWRNAASGSREQLFTETK